MLIRLYCKVSRICFTLIYNLFPTLFGIKKMGRINVEGLVRIPFAGNIILHDGVHLCRDLEIISTKDSKLLIKEGAFIGPRVMISCHVGISIGKGSLLGENVCIHDNNHKYSNRLLPIKEQGFEAQPIIIGDDVWIGANAILLPGITLGSGCVVAAGSVVTKSFSEYSVIAGVPARLINSR